MAGNLERLREAGLIVEPLPKAHSEVVQNLSDDEVDVIVRVAAQVREADEAEGLDTTADCPYVIHF